MNFFLHPERLYHLLWLVPAIIALYAFAEMRRRRALKNILGAPHFSAPDGVPAGTDISRGKRFTRFLLMLACAVLTAASWARPSWGEKIVPFQSAGRDIVVALDLSKSMLCEDIRPSRLAHAKRFAELLAERMRGDRFGLVPFAGTAFLACPLTVDFTGFRAILSDQEIGSIPLGGTNLEAALKTAGTAFETAENLGNAAIVLITDGGELSGSAAREAAKLRAAKIPVIVVGIGDPAVAAPIPLRDASGKISYLKDSAGNTVSTRLEEKPLAELAAETGGVYVRSTATAMGDETAAARLRELTPGALEESVHAVPIERRAWFLVPALAALLLYFLLSETRSETRGLRASAFALLLRSPKTPVFVAIALLLAGTRGFCAENAVPDDEKIPAETLCETALQAQESGEIARSRELYERALAKPGISSRLRDAATQNLGAGFHAEARKSAGEAAKIAGTDTAGALEKIALAEKNFAQAKTLYGTLLRANGAVNAGAAAENFRLLLNDEKRLAELKKQLEEQKKSQQKNSQNENDSDKNENENSQGGNENSGENSNENPQENSGGGGQNESKNSDDSQRDNDDENAGENENSAEEKNGGNAPESSKNSGNSEERALDSAAAEAVLRDMEKDEAERRKAILRSRAGGERSAEKDW